MTLLDETWSDGTPYGYIDYRASTLGRIYSKKTGKVLEGCSQVDKGYIKMSLIMNGEQNKISVHTIICTIFHGGQPGPEYTVDHINRIKYDNRPSNLRWATPSEQGYNKDPPNPVRLIAQIKDDKIVDFHDEQHILEIFDVDDIVIPDRGLYHDGYLWIYEQFTNFDIINERWAPIQVIDRIYLVSDMGRVHTNRKTFGHPTYYGYKAVALSQHSIFVHRAVVTAFFGDIGHRLYVNHLDRDKTNNKLYNLDIVTAAENVNHAVLTGTKSASPVRQISLDGEIIAEFMSIKSAAEATGINAPNISACANGIQFTSGNYRWEHI